ncbi:citramalate synthase [Herbivorax sp. ANBcel31]|uniref:homocitrate synthase/isopropylmalate synthase family protein n=1 Tax=Herbivorax sp. ANBcel31 TaxID=3069754 RepID=UPI0027B23900|nr:citramalate synthase [Herbivorax sp. ANBcel31]MDQ2087100.1 citramalate synthase [Herbivorax sp. ANBcel31]
MSFKLDNGRINIVDRTLPEIFTEKQHGKRLEIIYLCWLLKDVGVDYFEINTTIQKLIGKLPAGLDFIYRIENEEDAKRCIDSHVKKCVISLDLMKRLDLLNLLKKHNVSITIEYPVNEFEELFKIKYLDKNILEKHISYIRITGLDTFVIPKWINEIKNTEKKFKLKVNLCPQNEFGEATALCIEGIMNNIHFITTSFTGYGRENGYAPLEEVLLALKVLLNRKSKINLSKLSQIASFYSTITGRIIPENKPVIGEGIFKYQSGIHADGIEKNPITYELFAPCFVGQNRTLTIGKHSGKRAVQKKLKELGIKCRIEEAAEILGLIREKSVENKRDLFDQEIIDIYKENVKKLIMA